MKVRPDLDYIIVLGAHVAGTRLSKALLERTRRALRYLEENPETRAVLSGGQGQGEQISEAEAMYRYLTEHGIDGSRLILEDTSPIQRRIWISAWRRSGHWIPRSGS